MRTLGIIRTFTGACALIGASQLIAPSAVSAQGPVNLTVSASVSRNCTIDVASISFPAYDPVVANVTAGVEGQGNVQVACTKGVAPAIALGAGSNGTGGVRRLAFGTERLIYELYQGSGQGTVWGTTGGALLTATPALSRTARDFPVYGFIAGGQDVSAGAYSDTIVATVNF